ncbi:MAG: hypothetical protein NC416_11035 [Eubacterium sp.]|nr:hypothetical protein [Eubacterium sp.]
MTEQYRNQYKKEMAQVYAPLELIERTKAAVREEENRLQQQAAGVFVQEVEPKAADMDVQKAERRFTAVRRWAYPLTAAAAVVILVSVSLTMRGMKSGDSSMSGASEAPAMESPTEAIIEEAAEAEEGVVESTAGAVEEEAAAGVAEMTEAAIEEAVADFAEEPMADMVQMNSAADAGESGATAGAAAESARKEMADTESKAAKEELSDTRAADMIEDAAAALDSIMIEKVEKKPVFCGRSDTESHIYHEKVFRVRKDGAIWKAYVEAEGGGGYVLRGEAENLEAFLEAGYEKLMSVE